MPFIELEKGDVFDDYISILDHKEGGLGRVYFGFCKRRHIKVVIKTLRRKIWDDYNLAAKWPIIKNMLIDGSLALQSIDIGSYLYYIFFREGRLVCQAQNHYNVLKGTRLWWTEEGQPFFECEYIADSDDLADFHQKVKEISGVEHLSCLQVSHIALSFCNGMIYISDEMLRSHNQFHPLDPAVGFVHRDIKPANILLTPKNQIKIIDMGLAKFILATTPTMLAASPITSGTWNYMSPEQKLNYESVNPSSDVYSFGVLMYEMFGGRMPPVPDQRIGASEYLPREFGLIIEKCLHEHGSHRFAGFRELREAIIEFLKGVKNGKISLYENLRCGQCGYVSNRARAGRSSWATGTVEFKPHQMTRVHAGPFFKGCSREQRESLLEKVALPGLLDAEPYREAYLDAFEIDKYPVTNQQYHRFIRESGYTKLPVHWQNSKLVECPYPVDEALHPVIGISYIDALAYCKWAGLRLPTGDEWEKASRGSDGRLYPWGDQYDVGLCNTAESGIGGPVAVNQYPEGKSPYGCFQMTGNVFEWVDESPPGSDEYKYLRGGCWAVNCEVLGAPFIHYMTARQDAAYSGGRKNIFGFRCARSASESEDLISETALMGDANLFDQVPFNNEVSEIQTLLSETCPICDGSFIEFDPRDIKECEKNIYTWRGFFDIE